MLTTREISSSTESLEFSAWGDPASPYLLIQLYLQPVSTFSTQRPGNSPLSYSGPIPTFSTRQGCAISPFQTAIPIVWPVLFLTSSSMESASSAITPASPATSLLQPLSVIHATQLENYQLLRGYANASLGTLMFWGITTHAPAVSPVLLVPSIVRYASVATPICTWSKIVFCQYVNVLSDTTPIMFPIPPHWTRVSLALAALSTVCYVSTPLSV